MKKSAVAKSSTEKKSGGRPKGSLNKGGPLIMRIAANAQKALNFLDRTGRRSEAWEKQEPDENKKHLLATIREAVAEVYDDLDQRILRPLNELQSEGFTPPKLATAAIDYHPGRKVWIKGKVLPKFMEMGYTKEVLDNLVVFKVVGGTVVVEGGGTRFPVAKLYVAVRNPSEESAAA